MMDAKIPIPEDKVEFCLLCAMDHGVAMRAVCKVYSLDYGVHIPICCMCCQEKVQDIPFLSDDIKISLN